MSSSLSSVLGVAAVRSLADLAAGLVHTDGGAYLPGGRIGGSSVCNRSRREEKSRYEGREKGTGAVARGCGECDCHGPPTPVGRDEDGGLRLLAPALGRRLREGDVGGGEHATSTHDGE